MNGVRSLGWISAAFALTLVGCGASETYSAKSPSYGPREAAGYGQPGQAQTTSADRDGWFEPSAPAPAASAAPQSWGGSAAEESARAPQPTLRPGLGTEWGETLSSRITSTPFLRADAGSPFASSSMFYNDAAGARAMANAAGTPRATAGMFSMGGGIVTMGLKDENGNALSGFVSGGNNYVVGEAGSRYTIILRNKSQLRFEVVLSVDGLDVLDGKAASFSKRGYVLDPHGELEVDGFRQSTQAVAAFRFGSVQSSYSNQKHGETRNVGVIGVALFHERGTDPWSWNSDVDTRHRANPFPGQFATPP
ncbi:MAG: hypothetical protein IPK82_13190 [Polyangiaceae bacterium]|nr:hypothetical protein [Polyangiaceae bacterium]